MEVGEDCTEIMEIEGQACTMEFGGCTEIMEIEGQDCTMEFGGDHCTMESRSEEITPNQKRKLRLPASWTKIVMVASIAVGIQFGWALRVSLLTPYVQFLGIPHKLALLIWLFGPISSMIVEPLVGHYSDHCNSCFGRRSPFIVAGTSLVILAAILIGFAADIGYFTGDSLRAGSIRPRAIVVFAIGFFFADVAKIIVQGQCLALLADLSAGNERRTRTAKSFYAIFMTVGDVLGYTAGSLGGLYLFFSFTVTEACEKYCANMKSCFILFILLMVTLTTTALAIVREKIESQREERGQRVKEVPSLAELFGALKRLPRPMWILSLVTGLNWISWHPFFLYATDWMGREVYGEKVGVGATLEAKNYYNKGVRAGALGLMLNSIVFGVVSLALGHMMRGIRGAKRVWGAANILLAVCLALTVVVTKKAQSARHLASRQGHGIHCDTEAVAGALTLFAVLGIPRAIIYSIPNFLAIIFCSTSGEEKDLFMRVLNLSTAVSQIVVILLSGPWDNLFGGGNIPSFVVGAVATVINGVFVLTVLPSPALEMEATITRVRGFVDKCYVWFALHVFVI